MKSCFVYGKSLACEEAQIRVGRGLMHGDWPFRSLVECPAFHAVPLLEIVVRVHMHNLRRFAPGLKVGIGIHHSPRVKFSVKGSMREDRRDRRDHRSPMGRGQLLGSRQPKTLY